MFDCSVGDWLAGPFGGIWRVFRRERDCDLTVPGVLSEPPPGGLVFASRLPTAWGTYAPEDRTWHASLSTPLSRIQKLALGYITRRRSHVLAAFTSRTPIAPDLLFNVPLALPNDEPRALSPDFVSKLDVGLSRPEIFDSLSQSSLAPYFNRYPYSTTLQFRCAAHELRGRDFIFRSARWLDLT